LSRHFDHYQHTPEDLAAACQTGAANLRREAAQALAAGDQPRHDRKLRAAVFVEQFAHDVRDGTADLHHAQVVARAANVSGILIDARTPAEEPSGFKSAELIQAEHDYAARHKAELESAARAGLLSRVADPGQIPFYALRGYEPDGYDPHTQTTSLRDRHSEARNAPAEHSHHHTPTPEASVTGTNDNHNDDQRTESFAADTVTVDAIEFAHPGGPAGPAGPTPGAGRGRGDDYSRSGHGSHGSRTIHIGNLNAANATYTDNTPVAGTGPAGSAVAGAAVAYRGDEHGWSARVSHPDGRIEEHTSGDSDEDYA